MFWINKLNLFLQAWPSRSQPHIRNQGPCVPFLELLRARRKQEICSGWRRCSNSRSRSRYSLHTWLCGLRMSLSTARACSPLPDAPCSRDSSSATPGKAGDVMAGNLELSPCCSPHWAQVTWSLCISASWCDTENQATALTLTQQCSCEGWISQVRVRMKVSEEEKHIFVTNPLHCPHELQHLNCTWTITSLRDETRFSTSCFPCEA